MNRCAAAGTLLFLGFVLSGAGCDTDAVGVEDCREIERARCRAARHCAIGIETEEDVVDCERYVRDHCLHGLTIDEPPSARDLRRCVDAIEEAGTCARGQGGPDAPAASCGPLALNRTDVTVCELVISPDDLPGCGFLIDEPEEEEEMPPPEPDAGPEPPPSDAGSDDGASP